MNLIVLLELFRYHSLHHQEMGTNFCLFMPLFDVLGNTLNPNSWELQKQIRLSTGIYLAKLVHQVFSFTDLTPKAKSEQRKLFLV